MKVSYSWLKKFVEFDSDSDWLSHNLTMAGLEVDACEKIKNKNGQEDTVLEIGLTPNRSDCLSIMGVAREISALTGNPLKKLDFEIQESDVPVKELTSVTLEEPEMCPRYVGRVISNVKVGPSPVWLMEYLESIGQRTINNVVDVTNFVMFELGHPMHAFDYNLLEENRIVVRKARQGETFEAIDRTQCRLHEEVLVIADANKAVALAGIMGGLTSEVNENTGTVLLECAYFDPALVRKTSKEYKIHSESSHRFERGTDPNQLERVIDYAASLISELSGGKVAKGRIDKFPTPVPNAEINLRVERTNKILGGNIKAEEIQGYLERLGFVVSTVDANTFNVSVPTFRTDITREIDLIEEIARLNGYNKIQPTLPMCSIAEAEQSNLSLFNQKVKEIFSGFGFQEIITYSFLNKESFDYLQLPEGDRLRNCVSIINPISQEMDVLRTTLIPSTLETIARNINAGIFDLMFFEVGKVFQDKGAGQLPMEEVHLVAAVTEKVKDDLWNTKDSTRDFFSIKGVLQAFGERIHAEPWETEPRGYPFFASGSSVCLNAKRKQIGTMGEIHPRVIDFYKITQKVFLFELNLSAFHTGLIPTPTFEPVPRYPSTLRDIAIVVGKTVKTKEIVDAIQDMGGDTLREVSIFDQFEGGNIPEDQKSLAYSLVFRSNSGTLTDEEVDGLQQKILDGLGKKFNARLR